MAPSEGFEAWFQEIPFVERPANNIWFGKDAWLAACAWQRETDINEVYRGACSCGGDDSHALNCKALLIAAAIREQAGG